MDTTCTLILTFALMLFSRSALSIGLDSFFPFWTSDPAVLYTDWYYATRQFAWTGDEDTRLRCDKMKGWELPTYEDLVKIYQFNQDIRTAAALREPNWIWSRTVDPTNPYAHYIHHATQGMALADIRSASGLKICIRKYGSEPSQWAATFLPRLPMKKTWLDAYNTCKANNSGFRLPTYKEARLLLSEQPSAFSFVTSYDTRWQDIWLQDISYNGVPVDPGMRRVFNPFNPERVFFVEENQLEHVLCVKPRFKYVAAEIVTLDATYKHFVPTLWDIPDGNKPRYNRLDGVVQQGGTPRLLPYFQAQEVCEQQGYRIARFDELKTFALTVPGLFDFMYDEASDGVWAGGTISPMQAPKVMRISDVIDLKNGKTDVPLSTGYAAGHPVLCVKEVTHVSIRERLTPTWDRGLETDFDAPRFAVTINDRPWPVSSTFPVGPFKFPDISLPFGEFGNFFGLYFDAKRIEVKFRMAPVAGGEWNDDGQRVCEQDRDRFKYGWGTVERPWNDFQKTLRQIYTACNDIGGTAFMYLDEPNDEIGVGANRVRAGQPKKPSGVDEVAYFVGQGLYFSKKCGPLPVYVNDQKRGPKVEFNKLDFFASYWKVEEREWIRRLPNRPPASDTFVPIPPTYFRSFREGFTGKISCVANKYSEARNQRAVEMKRNILRAKNAYISKVDPSPAGVAWLRLMDSIAKRKSVNSDLIHALSENEIPGLSHYVWQSRKNVWWYIEFPVPFTKQDGKSTLDFRLGSDQTKWPNGSREERRMGMLLFSPNQYLQERGAINPVLRSEFDAMPSWVFFNNLFGRSAGSSAGPLFDKDFVVPLSTFYSLPVTTNFENVFRPGQYLADLLDIDKSAVMTVKRDIERFILGDGIKRLDKVPASENKLPNLHVFTLRTNPEYPKPTRESIKASTCNKVMGRNFFLATTIPESGGPYSAASFAYTAEQQALFDENMKKYLAMYEAYDWVPFIGPGLKIGNSIQEGDVKGLTHGALRMMIDLSWFGEVAELGEVGQALFVGIKGGLLLADIGFTLQEMSQRPLGWGTGWQIIAQAAMISMWRSMFKNLKVTSLARVATGVEETEKYRTAMDEALIAAKKAGGSGIARTEAALEDFIGAKSAALEEQLARNEARAAEIINDLRSADNVRVLRQKLMLPEEGDAAAAYLKARNILPESEEELARLGLVWEESEADRLIKRFTELEWEWDRIFRETEELTAAQRKLGQLRDLRIERYEWLNQGQ